MQTNNNINKNGLRIIFSALFFTLNTAWAESDMQLMEKALKAREGTEHKGMDHAKHSQSADPTGGFHGVFYGYLPCEQKGCAGIKMTLSLKQRNNYLLVTQYAKASSREYYEKGKYDWDDAKRILTLKPKKEAPKRQFSIEDEVTLIQLNSDGTSIHGDQEDYTFKRSDEAKTREMHIH